MEPRIGETTSDNQAVVKNRKNTYENKRNNTPLRVSASLAQTAATCEKAMKSSGWPFFHGAGLALRPPESHAESHGFTWFCDQDFLKSTRKHCGGLSKACIYSTTDKASGPRTHHLSTKAL